MSATEITYLIQTDSYLNYQPNHVFVDHRRRRGNGIIFTNPNLRISNLSSLVNSQIKSRVSIKLPRTMVNCSRSDSDREMVETDSSMDCVGTGYNVECINENSELGFVRGVLEWGLLISLFFFWGTRVEPFLVSAFRLIPAEFTLVAFAGLRGRKQPSGVMAWGSIVFFGPVDAACFQVIIDSHPLTVAILASLLFGESIGVVGAAGLVLGVVGLLLLELLALSHEWSNSSLWGSGEWWMLLAAQSMAVGTVMVRWVSKYSDPIMATGWHMVIGGVPLLVISVLKHDPAVSRVLNELNTSDILALIYTSIFGSAISYGVYFYNASRGSLTKLSSLTFLTPMFLGQTFSKMQLFGALVTVVAIYIVNYRTDIIRNI
ncbi:hypothetical protein MKX01_010266 [Papaver californicum]|nr:hypothetical protein MKX01_010266 [Papaver californicum]